MNTDLSNALVVLFEEWYTYNSGSFNETHEAASAFLEQFSALNFEQLDGLDLAQLYHEK